MGIDIGSIFNSAKESVEQTAKDAWNLGVTGGLAYLEDQAIKVIEADKNQNAAKLQSGVVSILNRPTSGDSLGGYITQQLQSPVLKQYGPYVILGVLLVGVTFVFMSRGK